MKQINVMLIDDNETTNFINKKYFQKYKRVGEITVFQSSEKALDHLINTNDYPHLIMLDLNMPGMDGWDFLASFINAKTDNLPIIIVLSTTPNPEEQKRARETSGVANIMEKPLTKSAVNQIITAYFEP
jgi:response regulator RpfG family c-di-GMP phosphodiesterase